MFFFKLSVSFYDVMNDYHWYNRKAMIMLNHKYASISKKLLFKECNG